MIVIAGALVAAGVAAAAMLYTSPEEDACEGLHRVCGDRISTKDCLQSLEGATPNEIEDVITCVEPAETCGEALVCLGGAALRDMGEGFFRGLTQTR